MCRLRSGMEQLDVVTTSRSSWLGRGREAGGRSRACVPKHPKEDLVTGELGRLYRGGRNPGARSRGYHDSEQPPGLGLLEVVLYSYMQN